MKSSRESMESRYLGKKMIENCSFFALEKNANWDLKEIVIIAPATAPVSLLHSASLGAAAHRALLGLKLCEGPRKPPEAALETK